MNTNKDNKAKLRDADAKQRRLEEMGSCNRLQRLRGCVTSKNTVTGDGTELSDV